MGLLLAIVVHPANIQDRDGAKLVLAKLAQTGPPRLEAILADGGYTGPALAGYVLETHGWRLDVVKRTELHRFAVIPKRWVVERTFGWLNNFRGLAKHYDHHAETVEAKVLLVSIFYLTKRLTTPPAAPQWSLENEQKIQSMLDEAATSV